MQYRPTIVSPPILYTERYTLPIGMSGDTLNISLDPEFWRGVTLSSARTPNTLPKPSVSIVEKNNSVIDTKTIGESFDVTVKLSKVLANDVTVDFNITPEIIPTWDDIRKMQDVRVAQDDFDYSHFIKPIDVLNLDIITGTITIPAGQLEASVTITSTPYTEMFYGKGSYYSLKVELSNVVSVDDVLLNNLNSSYVLLEDSFTYPKWGELEVELWGKMPELSYFQPIYDPETSSIVKWKFGYNTEDDGLGNITLTDPTLVTKIVDDIPLEEIQLRPVDKLAVAVDAENVTTPMDLSLTTLLGISG